jgi:hypothetical protein
MENKPLGFFVSYGIKPCAIDNCMMEEGKRLISADVCGWCSNMLEEKYQVPALFGVSAAGDQVPHQVAWIEIINEQGEHALYQETVEDGLKYVEIYGTRMGETAIAIAEKTQTETVDAVIQTGTTSVTVDSKEAAKGKICVEARLLTLGNLAFVGEKPEVNCVTEQQLLADSPYPDTFLLCMVNGGMKYMADADSYDRNTFEALRSAGAKGTAEAFVKVVIDKLQQML